MKFCKDCKFFKANNEYLARSDNLENAICMHEKAALSTNTNIITSEVTTNRLLCKSTRCESSVCGEEGKLFEPKETALSKLKSWFRCK